MTFAVEDPRMPERLRRRILVCEVTGCWLWRGGNSGSGRGGGYGRVSWLGITVAVHKLVWTLLGGRKLRPGEQLDHRCAARACCNPAHLAPLYQPRNVRLAYQRRRREAA